MDAVLARLDRPGVTATELAAELAHLPGSSPLPAPRIRYNLACYAAGGKHAPRDESEFWHQFQAAAERGRDDWYERDPSLKWPHSERRAQFRAVSRRGNSAAVLARIDPIGRSGAELLRRAGISSASELLRATASVTDRAGQQAALGIPSAKLHRWALLAELAVLAEWGGDPPDRPPDKPGPQPTPELRGRLPDQIANIAAIVEALSTAGFESSVADLISAWLDRAPSTDPESAADLVNLLHNAGIESKAQVAKWQAPGLTRLLEKVNTQTGIVAEIKSVDVTNLVAASLAERDFARVEDEPAKTPAAPADGSAGREDSAGEGSDDGGTAGGTEGGEATDTSAKQPTGGG